MDCLITAQLMAGEKQAKEVKKTVLPDLARPVAIAVALASATPASINLFGYFLAKSVKCKDDLRSTSTTKIFLLLLASLVRVAPNEALIEVFSNFLFG